NPGETAMIGLATGNRAAQAHPSFRASVTTPVIPDSVLKLDHRLRKLARYQTKWEFISPGLTMNEKPHCKYLKSIVFSDFALSQSRVNFQTLLAFDLVVIPCVTFLLRLRPTSSCTGGTMKRQFQAFSVLLLLAVTLPLAAQDLSSY